MPACGRVSSDRARHRFDFLISGPRDHGVPGLVNLFGIESPGLTSSLALADHVAAELGDRLKRREPKPEKSRGGARFWEHHP